MNKKNMAMLIAIAMIFSLLTMKYRNTLEISVSKDIISS